MYICVYIYVFIYIYTYISKKRSYINKKVWFELFMLFLTFQVCSDIKMVSV